MLNTDEPYRIPANHSGQTNAGLGDIPAGIGDLRVPLLNLSAVRVRMDSLQRFITESIHNNRLITKHQMDMVSSEIVSAIQQTIVHGASLLAYSQQNLAGESSGSVNESVTASVQVNGKMNDKIAASSDPMLIVIDPKVEVEVEDVEGDDEECEIIELDAVELLAEHVHFCEICGKGFKRDANLRMHMRAHGNQFKTPEALAKPDKFLESLTKARKTRFSCPFQGCNRNRSHKKFKALKSIMCVRNHFKRSHCPKMYLCNRCNKKSFSVLADLKCHLKHCGEAKWKCSCGTSFSRKDKLFGHMALFEGHMPAVIDDDDDDDNQKAVITAMEEGEDSNRNGEAAKREEFGGDCSDNLFFDGLLDGFGSIEGYCLQDMLQSPPGLNAGTGEFYDL